MPELPSPPVAARRAVAALLAWTHSRAIYRKLSDSRSSKPADVEKAKKKHVEDTNKLEAAGLQLDVSLRAFAGKGRKEKKPLPWKEIIGVIAKGAAAVDSALSGGLGEAPRKIIDVEATVVSSKKIE